MHRSLTGPARGDRPLEENERLDRRRRRRRQSGKKKESDYIRSLARSLARYGIAGYPALASSVLAYVCHLASYSRRRLTVVASYVHIAPVAISEAPARSLAPAPKR